MGILGKKGKFAQKKERKGLWRGAVTGIAAIVVFCTTYALILPAITMETQGLSCGLAEHTHSQDCYQLICGKQEYFSHSHSDECYENGALVCTLTERTLHHHSEDCYSKPEPICGLTEGQGHTHAESCYTTERTLVCTQSECSPHTHSDGCYTEEVIPCTQEAVEGHTHGEDCYTDGERTCGKEETQGHTHSEACTQTKQVLTCTLAETQGHRHSDECYEEKQLLSCGQEAREAHTHSESCYPSDFQPTLICDQEDIPEHRHSQDCYARICELEEHTHSELCVENHEAFLENQNEILKNDNEQTGSNENSSNEEAQNQGNSQEQASNNEEQNQENSQEQASDNEEQNQQNSQEQASNEQEQNQENSQEQASDNETQSQENSQQQASNNEEQNQQNSQEQASNEQTQNQENSQEQTSNEEEQNQENSEEQPSSDEEQNQENSQEQASNEEGQNQENSEEQASNEEEQNQENSQQQASGNEEQNQKNSQNELSQDGGTDDVDSTDGDVDSDSDLSEDTDLDSDLSEGTYSDSDLVDTSSEECSFTVSKPGWTPVVQRRRLLRTATYGVSREGNTETVDLGSYITNISIQKLVNNQWVDSTIFKEGDYVQVSISYSIVAGIVGEGRRVVAYQLPDAVTPIQTETGNVVFGGHAVGTYEITKDGLITITFDESFANDEAFTGNIFFRGSISAGDHGKGGEVTFPGGGNTITIEPKPDDSDETQEKHDIIVNKKGSISATDESTIQYTIEVSTQNGTKDGQSVVIGDYFETGNGVTTGTYNENSIVVKKVTSEGEAVLTKDTDYTLTLGTVDSQNNFTINGLASLEAGETYVVTYEATAIGAKADGSAMLKNHGYAKGGDDESHKWIDTELSKTRISKSGWNDKENNVIHWTITINEAGKDLAGWTISDAMKIGNTDVPLGDVVFSIKDSSGNPLKNSDNNDVTTLPYTFPEDEVNTNTYTITYTTPTRGYEDGTILSNTASLKRDTEEYSVPQDVTVSHRDWGLSKYKEYTDSPLVNGIQEYFWNAVVTIPSEDLAEFTYVDTINDPVKGEGQTEADKHYGIASDIETALRTGLWLEMEDGTKISYPTVEDSNVVIEVTYYSDTARSQTVEPSDSTTHVRAFVVSVKPKVDTTVTGAKKLYIQKYPTQADFSDMEIGETWTVSNTGEIPGLTSTPDTSYTKPAPLEKAVYAHDQWGNFSYTTDSATIQYDRISGKISYRLLWRNLNGTDATVVLTDTLPAGLSLVPDATTAKFYANEYSTWVQKYVYAPEYRCYDLSGEQNSDTKVVTGSATNPDGTTTVTITIPAGHNMDSKNDSIAVYYEAVIDWSDLSKESMTFTNRASWGNYGASQDTTVERDVPVIRKTGEQLLDELENGKYVVEYTVVINPGAKDLDPNSISLKLVDTLMIPDGVQAFLDMENTKLYNFDASAAASNYRGLEISAQRYQISFDQLQHTFTVQLPDELACVLVYRYVIDKGSTDTVQISNNVSLNGEWSSDKGIEIQSDTSGANVLKRGKVTIYKVDSEDFTKGLPGAKFLLEQYDPDEMQWKPVVRTESTDDSGLSTDGHYDTDENGEILFFQGNHTALPTLKLIRLTETNAPTGYKGDATARYFVIYPNTSTLAAAKEAVQSVIEGASINENLISYYKTGTDVAIYVPNESTSIRVQKIWLDESNNQMAVNLPESVTVQLYKQPMVEQYYTVTVDSYWRDSSWEGKGKSETIQVDHGSPLTISVSNWDQTENKHTVTIGNGQPQDMTFTLGNSGEQSTYTYTINSINEDLSIEVVTSVQGASIPIFALSGYRSPGWVACGDATAVGDPVTLNSHNEWSYVWTDLQQEGEGDPYYVVVEESIPQGYSVIYTNNGIKSGEITVSNKKSKTTSFTLPETGGIGSAPYTKAGLLLIVTAGIPLLYSQTKRKKGGRK